MKKLLTVGATLLVALTLATTVATAQVGPLSINAADFTKWAMKTTVASVVASPATFTVRANGFFAAPVSGISFTPIVAGAVLSIEAAGGTAENLTVVTASCPANQLENTCTFTANASFTHAAGATITSGDFGLNEAAAAVPTGTLVYVHKSTNVTLTAASTFTATSFIPAGVYLDAITINVLTIIGKNGGASTLWTFGDGTTADLWGTGLALAAGTTTTYSNYKTNYASIGIVKAALTPTGTATTDNFASGVVQINATYHTIVP